MFDVSTEASLVHLEEMPVDCGLIRLVERHVLSRTDGAAERATFELEGLELKGFVCLNSFCWCLGIY